MMERRRALMAVKKGGARLPAEYQEVEWIESTGSQGGQQIDTGIYPSSADVHQLKAYGHPDAVAVCGIKSIKTPDAKYSNSKLSFSFLRPGQSNGYNVEVGKSTYRFTVPRDEYPHSITIDIPNSIATLDDIDTISLAGADFQAQSMIPLHLFAVYALTTYVYYAMRIYDYSVMRNGKPIMHLIPCYRKADGAIGMYDIISRKFLTNMGPQPFLKGGDV